jgi:uncharacterized protein (DUF433 family)
MAKNETAYSTATQQEISVLSPQFHTGRRKYFVLRRGSQYGRVHVDIGTATALAVVLVNNSQTSAQASTNEQILEQSIKSLLKQCCSEHPTISIDKGIFGGVPHIKEMRLSVGDVLAQLYMLGSIQAVVDSYAPDLSEEQVKEAIAYAQDFLEAACEPHQVDG